MKNKRSKQLFKLLVNISTVRIFQQVVPLSEVDGYQNLGITFFGFRKFLIIRFHFPDLQLSASESY